MRTAPHRIRTRSAGADCKCARLHHARADKESKERAPQRDAARPYMACPPARGKWPAQRSARVSAMATTKAAGKCGREGHFAKRETMADQSEDDAAPVLCCTPGSCAARAGKLCGAVHWVRVSTLPAPIRCGSVSASASVRASFPALLRSGGDPEPACGFPPPYGGITPALPCRM